jgi:hypothetical protein
VNSIKTPIATIGKMRIGKMWICKMWYRRRNVRALLTQTRTSVVLSAFTSRTPQTNRLLIIWENQFFRKVFLSNRMLTRASNKAIKIIILNLLGTFLTLLSLCDMWHTQWKLLYIINGFCCQLIINQTFDLLRYVTKCF